MKIDILSDLHIDSWHSPETTIQDRKFKIIFEPFLPKEKGEVLVIAGDIGHYNKQNIDILKRLRDLYGYKIIYVWGNHDYYLVSKNQIQKYKNSLEKVIEFRNTINNEPDIYHLDGNIIEINGLRFGGCSGWYDGSLLKNTTDDTIQALWQEIMNDKDISHPSYKKLHFNSLHKEKFIKIAM